MEDYFVRASGACGEVRAFAVASAALSEEARRRHNAGPIAAAALGRLLSAGVMMGSMMKSPSDILTLQARGDGPLGGITVTADSLGRVKGYVGNPAVILPPRRGKLDVGGAVGKGVLSVVRDMGLREPYAGQTPLVTGEIAEDLTYYFAASEQTPSSVGLGVLMNKENTVRCAGGFILQLMPSASEETIRRLGENIEGIPRVTALLDRGYTPEELLGEAFKGLEFTVTDKGRAEFFCGCSKERVEKAVLSIGREGIRELIDGGEAIEVKCHFCNESYKYSLEELKEMLEKADRR